MRSRDASYFDNLYGNSDDPWQFATSAYERDKYAATLAALPTRRFVRALEIGCSIGIFTRALAAHCDAVLAIDISALPLRPARKMCADLPHVEFRQCTVPAEFPEGSFDLILASEVLYFLNRTHIAALATHTQRTIRPQGFVMLVNWLGPNDAPCSGDAAAELFIAASAPALTIASQSRTSDYRLDLLTTGPG